MKDSTFQVINTNEVEEGPHKNPSSITDKEIIF